MAISIFPSTAAEFVSNNFVIDMNDTSNNTADTGGVKQAGPYSMSFSSGDSSFDVYLIDDDGNSVGYSNSTSINASGLFSSVVILGVAQDEVISFTYQGSVNNADGEGDEPGAGAYLESISPTDLPSIDDTATVVGGNFGADTEITFESGATVLPAKSITVVSGTELLVTRPDNLDPALDPYDLKAINTGVTPPSSVDFVLTDAVTAGAVPTWVTTSPLTEATKGSAYSETLEATDADGAVNYAVTSGVLPTGLSLNSSTGEISGTPTASSQTFTVTVTDDGGNSASREFDLAVVAATGGTISSEGTFTYHTFTSSDDFVPSESLNIEYLIVAGGGSGGNGNAFGGGGGAGGLLSGSETLSTGTYSVVIGAGGVGSNSNDYVSGNDGSNTSFDTVGTAIGGGGGGTGNAGDPTGRDGGSGGGAGHQDDDVFLGGSGTIGQGNDGADAGSGTNEGMGGGGAGAPGVVKSDPSAPLGGIGLEFSDYATATSTGDSGYYAGGGSGHSLITAQNASLGGGGKSGSNIVENAQANTGGGGGGGGWSNGGTAGDGGSGIVIVRYAA